ncbi:hypothetical protein [Pseudomonas sp. OTU5201]|uniref:hypothetical protein n=1 Tax=Pseudomonas sp. OTU5201 TaxID=3043850 RepID=UPI00313D0710
MTIPNDIITVACIGWTASPTLLPAVLVGLGLFLADALVDWVVICRMKSECL